MPFGITGQTSPGMRQVVGFEDRSTGMGTFGANLGCAIVTHGDLLSQRRGPLPKLLWADLFLLLLLSVVAVDDDRELCTKAARNVGILEDPAAKTVHQQECL